MPRGGLEVLNGPPKTSKFFQTPATHPVTQRLRLLHEAQLRSLHP
jgi:hypothetical protein